ncbi:MAG TPA: ATP-binding protein [Candidatus Angelobacter sp.]|jgi:signal transduction histidine kinase|nr:ATP-binding protein [Candidatus Angelobacter sp.]
MSDRPGLYRSWFGAGNSLIGQILQKCLPVRFMVESDLSVSMGNEERANPWWLDLLWLLFLLSLVLMPPVREWHKLIIIFLIGIFQLLEGRFVRAIPRYGETLAVAIKLALAAILIMHTSDVPIRSSYYPIYYLPIVTAAMYFGPLGTLLWTFLTSAVFCSYLYPALKQYSLTREGIAELSLRIVFFFLVGMIVNRFVMESRLQTLRYRISAENLGEANRSLKKAQDEARRAERLAALGQLSAGLAHEIRNPLGVIKGSAEILHQKLSDSDSLSKELAGYIYTEVNRLSALVSRFLDFARPSQMQLRSQQLAPIVEKSLKYVQEQKAANKVSVHREYATALPNVMADEEFCDVVFTNLLLNACEAMGEAGGDLKIRIHPVEKGDHKEVAVEIEDTGPGIPAESREHIFNPFVTTKQSGVGLGLAIVTKIVDLHGGTVIVTSEPGRGACFEVSLPEAVSETASAEMEVVDQFDRKHPTP